MALLWHLAYPARMEKRVFKSKAAFTALLGKKLLAARKELGWKQDMLGAYAGVSNVYISHIESGKNNVSVFILYQLADTLGLKMSDLLPTVAEIDAIEEIEGEDDEDS